MQGGREEPMKRPGNLEEPIKRLDKTGRGQQGGEGQRESQ